MILILRQIQSFFFNNILLFPECVVYCIMKIPVSFNIKRFERNGPNIIQLLKTLFNKNNFNEHKLFLSELLRSVKEEIINKYKFAWLELEREPITKKMKRCIYMIEYLGFMKTNVLTNNCYVLFVE